MSLLGAQAAGRIGSAGTGWLSQARIRGLGLAAVAVFAFGVVPAFGTDYWLNAILIPFLIMALAGLGLNVLMGYAGQASLGTGAFMAVGAYATYNLLLRLPELPLPVSLVLAGLITGSRWPRLRHSEPAYQGLLLDRADARRAVLPGMGTEPVRLVFQLFDIELHFRAAAGDLRLRLVGPSRSLSVDTYHGEWFSPRSRHSSCAARPAVAGWPSATWTLPPR